MSLSELRRLSDLSIWDRILMRSPQRTRFLDRSFLDIFEVDIRYYGVFRKGVCVSAVPIIDTTRYASTFLPQCYYQGPILFDEIYRAKEYKRVQNEIELAEFTTTELAKVEDYFAFSLHPDLSEVRGYDWAHYHSDNMPRCQILPRYTARFHLEGHTHETLRLAGRSARRQEEGYAVTRDRLSKHITKDVDTLLDLYCETFARQGKVVNIEELSLLRKYISYFESLGVGQILSIHDQAGLVLAAGFVFEDYKKIWNVPLIATGTSRYAGTLLYYHILDHVMAQKGLIVDFNGANSPSRAYFKHSIGASSQMYFDIIYDNRVVFSR